MSKGSSAACQRVVRRALVPLMVIAWFSPPWKDCRPPKSSLSTANLMLPPLVSPGPANPISPGSQFDQTREMSSSWIVDDLSTLRGVRARQSSRVRDELPTRERHSPCAVQSSCGRHLATLKSYAPLSAPTVQVLCSLCPPLQAPSSLP